MTSQKPHEDKLESLKDLMSVVSSAEVGLVILDINYTIRVWNLFMVNHSAQSAENVMGKNIFECFPAISKEWFSEKTQQSILNKEKIITTWDENPYLFQFKNTRQRSKSATYMYQNITFIPLASANGEIENFAITINDVTDIAASTQQLDAVVSEYTSTINHKK